MCSCSRHQHPKLRTSQHQLNLHPYRAQHVPALNDTDLTAVWSFVKMKLERFADDKLIDKVIWLDELQFRLNWTLQLTVTTTSLGLHLSSQTGRCSSFAAISDGLVELSSEGLIGSHFFGGESCLHDSETVLWSAVRRGGLNFFRMELLLITLCSGIARKEISRSRDRPLELATAISRPHTVIFFTRNKQTNIRSPASWVFPNSNLLFIG